MLTLCVALRWCSYAVFLFLFTWVGVQESTRDDMSAFFLQSVCAASLKSLRCTQYSWRAGCGQ